MTPMSSQQAIARLTRRPPEGASKLLRSEPLRIDAVRGFARIAFLGSVEFATETGFVHNGFLAAMLDEAMAIAAAAAKDFKFVVPTLEHFHFRNARILKKRAIFPDHLESQSDSK